MRGVTHLAVTVAYFEIGMMVFTVGYPGDGVHKGDRLVVVLESESTRDLPVIGAQCPVLVERFH